MSNTLQHYILYSCVEKIEKGHEQFVPEHALSYLLSGEIEFFTEKGREKAEEGCIALIRRNQLAKAVKIPPKDGSELKSVNIFLTQDILRRFAEDNNIHNQKRYSGESILLVPDTPFIKAYFASLIPYFEQPEELTNNLAEIKTREAIELLLKISPQFREVLFDFNEPYKIDLESYMNRNFMFNVPIEKFAKLTGRSLATFKRDFNKTFQIPPQRWLLKKRLDHAHFLISQQHLKPTEAYVDAGFENLSHFSSAFKQMYGYNPSELVAKKIGLFM